MYESAFMNKRNFTVISESDLRGGGPSVPGGVDGIWSMNNGSGDYLVYPLV
jgi:hypothetical protein